MHVRQEGAAVVIAAVVAAAVVASSPQSHSQKLSFAPQPLTPGHSAGQQTPSECSVWFWSLQMQTAPASVSMQCNDAGHQTLLSAQTRPFHPPSAPLLSAAVVAGAAAVVVTVPSSHPQTRLQFLFSVSHTKSHVKRHVVVSPAAVVVIGLIVATEPFVQVLTHCCVVVSKIAVVVGIVVVVGAAVVGSAVVGIAVVAGRVQLPTLPSPSNPSIQTQTKPPY